MIFLKNINIEMMILQLYMDFMSQPSRAVYMLLKFLELQFEVKIIRFNRYEQRTAEFLKINPIGQIPVIIDNGFILSESHAIMRYIITSRNIQTSLYPLEDVKTCAKIDEYLDYHHNNTRKCSLWWVNQNVYFPLGLPLTVDLKLAKEEALKALIFLDQVLLQKSEYLCGNQLTIADISCFCEVIQVMFVYPDLQKHQNISRWLNKIYLLQPAKEAHQIFMKMITKSNPNPKF